MKKKVICILLALVMALGLCLPVAAANIRNVQTYIYYRRIKIVINDILISPCDEKGNSTEPFIMNDTTYLPVRAIAGALGLNVGWEPSTSTVVLERGGEENFGNGTPVYSAVSKPATITYRGTKINLDGENIPLVNRNGDSVEPFIYNGTNYLPLRVVSEALGLSVSWDGISNTVTMKGRLNSGDGETADPDAEKTLMPIEAKYSFGYTGFADSFEELMTMSYSYSPTGRLLKVSSGDGSRVMSCNYDNEGRLSGASVDNAGAISNYRLSYGSDGELAAIYVNGILSEGYYCETDAAGRVVREDKTPDQEGYYIFKYFYDDEGRLEREIKNNGWNDRYTDYFYDSEGRLIKTVEHNGKENLNLATAAYTAYSYDSEGRLIKEETFNDSAAYEPSKTIEYSYNAAGQLAKKTVFTLSASMIDRDFVRNSRCSEIYYTYDEMGRLVQEWHDFSEGSRPTVDSEFQYTKLSEIEHKYGYDEAGRDNYYHYKYYDYEDDSTTIEEKSWTYDSAGELTAESSRSVDTDGKETTTETVYEGGKTVMQKTVEHSVLHLGEAFNISTETWTYNKNGDLLNYRSVTTNEGSIYDGSYADVFENVSETVCEYDESGLLTKKSVINMGKVVYWESYSYSAEGLLLRSEKAAVENGTSNVVEMSYTMIPKIEQHPYLETILIEFVA